MIFFSVLKTLIGERITVEMKNDVLITGTLDHVDQYLNIKLSSIEVQEEEKHPHLLSVAAVFIRGSVVRYIHLPKDKVNCDLLQDAARREAKANHKK